MMLMAMHQWWLVASLCGWEATEKCDHVVGVGASRVCAPVLVSRQVFLLSSLGMGWVFPAEHMESELCAKIVGFRMPSYCVLSRTIGLE